MNQTVYHVLLEGRTIGPYDRRTIVGMHIKKTLTSNHVLISTGGAQLTVGDLIRQRTAQPFNPDRSGGFSLVQAMFPAGLLEVDGPGMAIPEFKDEVQVRIQGDVLRVGGRFRRGLGWKEGRVKIALNDVIHARVKGSQVDLWLRNPGQTGLQRIALELFTPEAAEEFVDWLPAATPFPEAATDVAVAAAPSVLVPFSGAPASRGLWVALAGMILVVALMLMVLLLRRRV